MPKVDKCLAIADAGSQKIGISNPVVTGIGEPRRLYKWADGLKFIELMQPFSGQAVDVTETVVIDGDLGVGSGETVKISVFEIGNAAIDDDIALIELLRLVPPVEFAVQLSAGENGQPRRNRVRYLAADGQPGEI